MSCYGKYSKEEKKIVDKITSIQRYMVKVRNRYIDLDVKRINLIAKLNGKFIEKRNR